MITWKRTAVTPFWNEKAKSETHRNYATKIRSQMQKTLSTPHLNKLVIILLFIQFCEKKIEKHKMKKKKRKKKVVKCVLILKKGNWKRLIRPLYFHSWFIFDVHPRLFDDFYGPHLFQAAMGNRKVGTNFESRKGMSWATRTHTLLWLITRS